MSASDRNFLEHSDCSAPAQLCSRWLTGGAWTSHRVGNPWPCSTGAGSESWEGGDLCSKEALRFWSSVEWEPTTDQEQKPRSQMLTPVSECMEEGMVGVA